MNPPPRPAKKKKRTKPKDMGRVSLILWQYLNLPENRLQLIYIYIQVPFNLKAQTNLFFIFFIWSSFSKHSSKPSSGIWIFFPPECQTLLSLHRVLLGAASFMGLSSQQLIELCLLLEMSCTHWSNKSDDRAQMILLHEIPLVL